jgi:hypothetical protein
MDAGVLLKFAIVVAAALALGWIYLAYFRRDREKTQHMLDPFLRVLEDPAVGRSPWGYECAEGRFDGRPAHVCLVPDSLITRTLPTLWLEMRWARRNEAWLCIILAANGMEYFSDDVDEGTRLVSPADWPESVVVRGKGPESAALARRLRGLDLTAYHDLKMLTLSERETKVVMRCARADVPYYRVLRSAEFPQDSVKPDMVNETARVLRDVECTLDAEKEVA